MTIGLSGHPIVLWVKGLDFNAKAMTDIKSNAVALTATVDCELCNLVMNFTGYFLDFTNWDVLNGDGFVFRIATDRLEDSRKLVS